jgi:hypothetical protein
MYPVIENRAAYVQLQGINDGDKRLSKAQIVYQSRTYELWNVYFTDAGREHKYPDFFVENLIVSPKMKPEEVRLSLMAWLEGQKIAHRAKFPC